MDCSDVIMLQPPETILAAYKSLFPCGRLIFNAEKNIWPPWLNPAKDDAKATAALANSHRYLNGGVWIGKTATAREVFSAAVQVLPSMDARIARELPPAFVNDDQAVMRALFTSALPIADRLRPDYHCQLTLCIKNVPRSDLWLSIR